MSGTRPWPYQVLAKTGDQRHAAVVPILEGPDSAALFCSFLEFPTRKIEVRAGGLNSYRVEMSSTVQTIEWLDAQFDDPVRNG